MRARSQAHVCYFSVASMGIHNRCLGSDWRGERPLWCGEGQTPFVGAAQRVLREKVVRPDLVRYIWVWNERQTGRWESHPRPAGEISRRMKHGQILRAEPLQKVKKKEIVPSCILREGRLGILRTHPPFLLVAGSGGPAPTRPMSNRFCGWQWILATTGRAEDSSLQLVISQPSLKTSV